MYSNYRITFDPFASIFTAYHSQKVTDQSIQDTPQVVARGKDHGAQGQVFHTPPCRCQGRPMPLQGFYVKGPFKKDGCILKEHRIYLWISHIHVVQCSLTVEGKDVDGNQHVPPKDAFPRCNFERWLVHPPFEGNSSHTVHLWMFKCWCRTSYPFEVWCFFCDFQKTVVSNRMIRKMVSS